MSLKRNFLFGTTAFVGLLAIGLPAMAQDTSAVDPVGEDEIDSIVVTGSLIRRDPTNAPTPLIQVTQEALLTTGQSTVIDYLATIPALSNSVVPSDTTGSGLNDGGLSLPNLRSLGSGRTLTLVDGRRHVSSQAGSLSVDVDQIPRLLIENIEIVTGGASSIYGADAVSGVLNFILRKDFEGLELDANYGMINQDGQANKRISGLIGHNFFDDRLNVYLHAEYEELDAITSFDIDWLQNATVLLGTDADPTNPLIGPATDGEYDSMLFSGLRRMDRPRWGQTTLANVQQPSALNDPDVPVANCTAYNSANCFGVTPGKTWWYEGTTARLANFGTRVGNTGVNRPFNLGDGDGVNPADFSTDSRFPMSENSRFQTGFTFELAPQIEVFGEAKYVDEQTFDRSQPTFFDINLANTYGANSVNSVITTSQYNLRWSDNAFLPQNVKDAIAINTITNYSAPTNTTPGVAGAPVLAQYGRHSMFGPEREQSNEREITRFVGGIRGSFDQIAFVKDVDWDLGYTYGELKNVNNERGIDTQRFWYASDAVVDTLGEVNGVAGEIVCRIQLIEARALPLADAWRGGDLRDTQYGLDAIDECEPLNVFGAGNQSDEALAYIDAAINVRETNEQEQFLATVSGRLWDFWGAGSMGIAVGAEHRREYTEGVGRDADTAGRLLFLNTGPDFLGAEYESDELFTELSVPLFRDSWLGDYAELSGSYRWADYTTVGEQEVYGVNLVYRPIQDIAFKTSFNTSIRVPNLAENFRPASQTFLNGFVDPCHTNVIAGLADASIKANRIANCTTLAGMKGLSYDFGQTTVSIADDFLPIYSSGIAGVNSGNPFLEPEESESFTFSTVLEPRFIPNLTLILDYYEIEITNAISAVSAQIVANNCVNGPTLNTAACATIFRNDPAASGDGFEAFKVGAPAGDAIGGFIQGSINYAAFTTRGIDFTVNYSFDFEEMLGRNWGQLNYSLGGLYLLEQETFTDPTNPSFYSNNAGLQFFPRTRFSQSLTYAPNDIWSVNWTMDWQTSQHIIRPSAFISNNDQRPLEGISTGDFARHDLTFRWNVNDDLSLRTGVVNVFDNEPTEYLGTGFQSNLDPWGRRFFIGLNFRPW